MTLKRIRTQIKLFEWTDLLLQQTWNHFNESIEVSLLKKKSFNFKKQLKNKAYVYLYHTLTF